MWILPWSNSAGFYGIKLNKTAVNDEEELYIPTLNVVE